jgi:hypothetical protein
MSYGAPQHGIDATGDRPGPVKIPDLSAGVGIDVGDPKNPIVLVELKNLGMAATLRIEAKHASRLFAELAAAVMQASQQALAAAGPQLVTPNDGAGRLLVPTARPVPGSRP